MNIALIGMPGAGKSVVGAELARIVRGTLIDPDIRIEDRYKKSLQEVLNEVGMARFLRIEAEISKDVFRDVDGIVLATGGSIVYSKDAMEELRRKSTIIYLKADYDTIARRIGDRPRGIVGLGERTLRALFEERCGLYEQWADVIVGGTGDPAEVALQCADAVRKGYI